MDMIVMTAIVFAAIGVMVSYGLRPTEERLPVRIRVEDRRKR
ncbi:hypothetical protein [Celeribacter neptunius]|uniref:Uncharacterized protein n=1 Tax=Celeribacter neptunius TaxID=588602 RepID=A0A1I3KSE8_9RHOB|nr:hypothetical protein [Celeribacter neptunius]SFI75268.1 hypothetical protein SAMN04487991_0781 [Celeribacter neptunius]